VIRVAALIILLAELKLGRSVIAPQIVSVQKYCSTARVIESLIFAYFFLSKPTETYNEICERLTQENLVALLKRAPRNIAMC
jgi:hypothetical protein